MSTRVLSIEIDVIHSDTDAETIGMSTCTLRTVQDAADVAAEMVHEAVSEIDATRVCSLIVATAAKTREGEVVGGWRVWHDDVPATEDSSDNKEGT